MLGNELAQVLNLKIPGSIIGILLVIILLQAKIIRLEWIESGANILIAELMLFFIPSAVGVMQYKQVMAADGMRFELVIFLSTLTVMICTGFLSEMANKIGGER
jgi:holin-like protein